MACHDRAGGTCRGLLAGVLHKDSHAVARAVAFAVFGAGAAAQIVLSRAARRTQAGLGLAALVAGPAMVTAAVLPVARRLLA
jgi:hypothetical protein